MQRTDIYMEQHAPRYQNYIMMKKYVHYASDTSRLSRLQILYASVHVECDYSSRDRDLVLAVNQHQSFPDRQRACSNTVTQGKVQRVATLTKRP